MVVRENSATLCNIQRQILVTVLKITDFMTNRLKQTDSKPLKTQKHLKNSIKIKDTKRFKNKPTL